LSQPGREVFFRAGSFVCQYYILFSLILINLSGYKLLSQGHFDQHHGTHLI
jgi:hypothetical protein